MKIAENFFVYASAFCAISALVMELRGLRDSVVGAFLACSMLVGYFLLAQDPIGVGIAAFFVGYFTDLRRGADGSAQTKE